MVKRVAAGCLLLVLFSFVALCLWLKAVMPDPAKELGPFNFTQANQVIALIKAGKLREDRTGVMDVPQSIGLRTEGRVITVRRTTTGLLLVYFPTRHSRFGARGYLYCSRPLKPSDLVPKHDCGGYSPCIKLVDESSRYVSRTPPVIYPYFTNIVLAYQITPYWWRIEYSEREV